MDEAEEIVPNRGSGVVHPTWDMRSQYDRGLVRKAARWQGMDDDFKSACVDGLKAALPAARSEGDYKAVNDIVKTAAVLEGQNQKDEHKAAELQTQAATAIIGRLPAENVVELAQQIALAKQSSQTLHVEQSLQTNHNDNGSAPAA